eukprot:2210318-Prymnesium_polylepis.1
MVHIIQKLRPSPSLCTVAQTARITAQTAAWQRIKPKGTRQQGSNDTVTGDRTEIEPKGAREQGVRSTDLTAASCCAVCAGFCIQTESLSARCCPL